MGIREDLHGGQSDDDGHQMRMTRRRIRKVMASAKGG
jgi:hypothetical protein